MLAELRHFRRDHCLTIWLVLIARKIFLMIIFGDEVIIDGGHFRNNGAVPDLLGIQLADGLFGDARKEFVVFTGPGVRSACSRLRNSQH